MRRQRISILTISAFSLIAITIIVIGVWEIFPQAQSQTLSNASQEQVSAAELSAAIETQRQSSAMLTRSASFDQKLQKLIEKAQKKGTVSVMVKVRAAFRPEGQISSAAETLAQRQLIQEAQDQMLSWLRYVPSTLKKYGRLPYISVSVDEIGLQQLQASSEALDISENKLLRLAMAESLTRIGAQRAWAGEFKGTGKIIAVIDSGVDKNHSWLSGKVVSEACYSTTDEGRLYSSICPDGIGPTDPGSGVPCSVPGFEGVVNCGHGTHIAGIAAGTGGVAYAANVISIQVMSQVNDSEACRGQASCLLSDRADVLSALNRVIELRTTYNYDIAAVNISLAGDTIAIDPFPNTCDDEYPAMTDAINQLRSLNIPTIIASGNDGATDAISFPACISSAVRVGATGDGSATNAPVDEVLQSSNSASFLNLLAPGSLITSSVPGVGVTGGSGTSQAAAHVSGAMALLRQELPIGTNNTVWFDDALPAGAVPYPDDTAAGGVTESWNWVTANPTPYAGTKSHQSSITTGIRQHFFTGATSTLQVGTGEILYTWVYLDSANMPSEIMLQWNDGVSWEHRAYWGANTIQWGQDGTPSRINMGRLPQADGWVKLVVPAHAVGLEGKTVNGMAFTQHGGRVTWDHTGKGSASVDDLLTLLSSTGVLVTDTRLGANERAVPRIKVDAALGVSIPDQAWVGEYYNNINLNGAPVLVKKEDGEFIDRYFNGASPAPGAVGAENYSIRWTRKQIFNQGNYRFSVTGDDGVRLYIDGQLKIDEWRNQASTTYNVNVDLSPGNHDIKLEYYQATGPAQARLTWGISSLSCLQTVADDRWRGEYFNNANLAGHSVMVRDDGINNILNFDWGAGGPGSCNVFTDYFSVRWTRMVNFAQGKYRFTLNNVDDGVRLYIGGQLKIDQWVIPAGTHTVDVDFPFTGDREIKLEYFENNGLAFGSLSWLPAPSPPTNLGAIALSSSQIKLNWIDTSNVESGFKIERWNGSSWAQITTVGANQSEYIDSGLASATTFYYRVRAFNSVGDSAPSNESNATTLLAAPSNLVASMESSSQIFLIWTDNSSNENGFKIERWNGSSWAQVHTTVANQNAIFDFGLAPSTTYYYRVRAFYSTGDSAYSNESSATTGPASCPGFCTYVHPETVFVSDIDPCMYPSGGCPDGSFPNGYGCCVSLFASAVNNVSGNGFDLMRVADGVFLDMNSDGLRERLFRTSAGSGDVWLALDRNNDVIIDNGAELFGNFTPQPNPPPGKSRNGFIALVEYDKPASGGNGEARMDLRDSIFSSLRLFKTPIITEYLNPMSFMRLPSLGSRYWISTIRSRDGRMNAAIGSGGEPGLKRFAALRSGAGRGRSFLRETLIVMPTTRKRQKENSG